MATGDKSVTLDVLKAVHDADGISDVKSAIQQKVTEPQTEGTSGQVLTTDGNGGRSWTTVQGGGGTSDLVVRNSTKRGVDLDFSDNNGNVILRLTDGHIKTAGFDSNPIETYSASVSFADGVANTVTINHSFSKGDVIYFHLDDGLAYYEYGKYGTYYEGSSAITGNRRGTNGYFRHVVSADCNSVGLKINSGQYTAGTALTLYVYKINGEVKPKIVTVKSDGTGMFTTIKSAIESITDANHLTNPYVIEVYPGTYNTLDGYTTEEISSASGTPSQTSMVGPKLTDGISIRGIGRRDEIILTAELDTSVWSSTIRGQISTLNIQGEGNIENLTIIGKHIRYCVHDDFNSPANSHDKRVVRNCKFGGEYLAYYPLFTTYGAGMSYPRDYLIEDCDFGYDLGIHTNSGFTYGCEVVVNNCSGNRFRIGDNASAEGNAVNRFVVNNCNFQVLSIRHTDETLSPHITLEGVGNEMSMVQDKLAGLYRLGNIYLAPTGLTTGTMVKRVNADLTFEATNNKDVAYGIVIGSDSDYSYIQRCGYICSLMLGLTGLSIGNYLTVNNSGSIITGGTASNAVGVVTATDANGNAYIKILI